MTGISKSHSVSLEDNCLLRLTINIAVKRKIANYSPCVLLIKKEGFGLNCSEEDR